MSLDTLTAADLNLDAMPERELESFAAYCGTCRCNARAARQLFPNRQRGYRAAATLLSNYAWNRLTATRLRLAGNISAAAIYEDICDSIYDRLPDWARGW